MPATEELRLPRILGDRLLEVPDYQRPFAWRDKQLQDLWEDLDLLGPRGSHYAGTLVLRDVHLSDGSPKTSMDDDGNTLRHSEVVDGQQRLTTCILLLDRIRRRLVALDVAGVEGADKIAANILNKYEKTSVNTVLVPKLRLASDLNEYWISVVLGEQPSTGEPMIAGHRRLAYAVAFFDSQLDGLTHEAEPTEQLRRLRELQRRITDGLGFLVYEVASLAEVGVIFETLNERGRPLTELEKTKNYLLYLARTIRDGRGDDLAQRINRAWSKIFSNLGRESDELDDQLLAAHWYATHDPRPAEWKRIASVKQRFERSMYVSGATRIAPQVSALNEEDAWTQLYNEVTAYVQSLAESSLFFAEMFDEQAAFEGFGADVHRQEARVRSAALRRSGVVAIYRPLLLAARLAHPGDGALYSELVDLCERFSARVFVIQQLRSNTGQPRLFRLAHDLYSGTDPAEILTSVRSKLWEYAPDDRVRATLQSTEENWYRRRGHKYLLYEYERSQIAEGELMPPFATFTESAREQRTTEHILPQQPDADAACWWDAFSRDQHGTLCHALGNLVLTLDNSVYSNKCFKDKRGEPHAAGTPQRPCYAQGKLRQERELAHYKEWTPETISERQLQLADWALLRWSVPSPEPEEVEKTARADQEIEKEGTEDDSVALV